MVACEGDDLNLECPTEFKLHILDGFFGRTDSSLCASPGLPTDNENCPNIDSKHVVSSGTLCLQKGV